MCLLYAVLAMALNMAMGYAGMLSIGHAAFLAIGAYSEALMARAIVDHYNLSHLPVIPYYLFCLTFAVTVSGLAGGILAIFGSRLKDDYFLMTTFAFGAVLQDVFRNVNWTGGNLGVRGIPQVFVANYTISTGRGALCTAIFIFALVYWFCSNVERSRFGLALYTVSEHESLSITLGEMPLSLKARSLATSAALTGLVGGLLAPYYHYIDPSFFGLQESILIFSMVMIGGLGSRNGAVLGASLLIIIPNLLPFLRVPLSVDASLRQILYGIALVVIMRFRPFGLVGNKRLR